MRWEDTKSERHKEKNCVSTLSSRQREPSCSSFTRLQWLFSLSFEEKHPKTNKRIKFYSSFPSIGDTKPLDEQRELDEEHEVWKIREKFIKRIKLCRIISFGSTLRMTKDEKRCDKTIVLTILNNSFSEEMTLKICARVHTYFARCLIRMWSMSKLFLGRSWTKQWIMSILLTRDSCLAAAINAWWSRYDIKGSGRFRKNCLRAEVTVLISQSSDEVSNVKLLSLGHSSSWVLRSKDDWISRVTLEATPGCL